ncbi:hypothetical protein QBC40DRAFT_346694 [Triangularia verruculosa]|uniref:Transposase n=1 Tax=Triangularia verruculosa TaxID=2587418 RepID=A0AAN6XMD2_9PEZI|nr:hypothetical protein QBC40DRAFT_346694 [Triangularia verruculosa]
MEINALVNHSDIHNTPAAERFYRLRIQRLPQLQFPTGPGPIRSQPRRLKLTARHRKARLAFAREQLAVCPRPEDWETVLFSDETWATNNHMWKRWLTIHDLEDIEAWASIRQKPHGWMFWGSICGRMKGPSFVWEKEYGGINSEKYQRYIVPLKNFFLLETLCARPQGRQNS